MSGIRRPSEAELQAILKRGVADVIVEAEFAKLLRSESRPARLKQGFDPSAPDIHLGHVVGLRKLRQLQELGHQVVLIVGDWTAQIGDPSGRSATRPMLSAEQVRANAETYMAQFFKVVDQEKTEVRWQTEWFGDFDLAEVIRLTRRFTVAQLLRREDFANRFQSDQPIAITELLYPLLQAYDSVMVEADVEFGGTDQRFNNLLGRELQQQMGQRPQQVFLVPILVGTDGVQKMGKSLGNYVGVAEEPTQMFGKLMSIPDELVPSYFELLTDLPEDDLATLRRRLADHSVNPMDAKKRLAADLVAEFHGGSFATAAQEHFERTVQRKQDPDAAPPFPVSFRSPATGPNADVVAGEPTPEGLPVNVVKLAVQAGMAASGGEARRLLQQGAIRIGGRQLSSAEMIVTLADGDIVRVGNRRFVRVVDQV